MIYTLTLNPALDLELTVDNLPFNQVLRARDTRTDCGGKGFNVSRALAALGEKSTALGFVGGSTGKKLEETLNQMGISTDFVYVSGETRTNVSIVTEPPSDYLKVNQPGPTIQPGEVETLLTKIHKLAKAGDYWVLSGSLPPGLTADIYAQIIRVVQSKGAKAVLDTSGDPLRLGCRAGPFMVKPNAVEARQLTGIEIEDHAAACTAAEKIRSLGATVVVISLGKQGVILDNGEVSVLAEPPIIQEHNPIGAGDALVGGLVWGLNREMSLVEALRWAVASGAAAASLPGTGVGSFEQIKKLEKEIRIISL
jgi:1-phosphofructokinase family hexose kinase